MFAKDGAKPCNEQTLDVLKKNRIEINTRLLNACAFKYQKTPDAEWINNAFFITASFF